MAEQSQKRSRLWRGVLVASLAMNMAVVGVVAGFALKGRSDGPPQRFDFSLGPIGAALSREDRRAIVAVLRDNPEFKRPRRGETPPAIAALVAALRADEVDEAALRAATLTAGARIVAIQAAVADAFVDRVLLMDLTARRALADRMEENGANRHGSKR